MTRIGFSRSVASMKNDIDVLKEALKKANRIAALTGAGISGESGIPTFRGADGLWQNYRATDLASSETFARDTELVWRFCNWRRDPSLGGKISGSALGRDQSRTNTSFPLHGLHHARKSHGNSS